MQQDGLNFWQVGKIIKVVLGTALELTSNQGQLSKDDIFENEKWPDTLVRRVDKTVLLRRTVETGYMARSMNQRSNTIITHKEILSVLH